MIGSRDFYRVSISAVCLAAPLAVAASSALAAPPSVRSPTPGTPVAGGSLVPTTTDSALGGEPRLGSAAEAGIGAAAISGRERVARRRRGPRKP